jgi:predicted DNA-binding transcriptional regulator AlpA
MADRDDVLPKSLAPRGLSRVQAAAYIGVSPSLFDEMVKDGRMPKPMRINARTVWDRIKLDEAFAALSDGGDGSGDAWSSVRV